MAKLVIANHKKKIAAVPGGTAHASDDKYYSPTRTPKLALWSLPLCSEDSSTTCCLNMYDDRPFPVYCFICILNFSVGNCCYYNLSTLDNLSNQNYAVMDLQIVAIASPLHSDV